jgi:hypothetical protein
MPFALLIVVCHLSLVGDRLSTGEAAGQDRKKGDLTDNVRRFAKSSLRRLKLLLAQTI